MYFVNLIQMKVGALIHESSLYDGRITFLGEILAQLPLDVYIGKLIIIGFLYGLFEEVVTIAAICSLRSFFTYKIDDKLNSFKSKMMWSKGSKSDLLLHLNAYNVFFVILIPY